LLRFYRENDWADWYVLPDHVPLSSDDPEEVWHKVRTTAEMSTLFFQEMPIDLRHKALPVVQGHSFEQIEYCLEKHLALGIKKIGFGSFGTNGKASSVNSVTPEAISVLAHLGGILDEHQVHLHAFGVGTPPVIYLLYRLGVNSFDSAGWMKTAGYGKIYMPFVRAYNVTYRDPKARGMTEEDFLELKELTGHSCRFCDSFDGLVQERYARIMHNLAVVLDTVQSLGEEPLYVPDVLASHSPFYARLAEAIQ
jgi:queuine/archaeosine tRNA-ribosyltransferase